MPTSAAGWPADNAGDSKTVETRQKPILTIGGTTYFVVLVTLFAGSVAGGGILSEAEIFLLPAVAAAAVILWEDWQTYRDQIGGRNVFRWLRSRP